MSWIHVYELESGSNCEQELSLLHSMCFKDVGSVLELLLDMCRIHG
jgi:hypothetical protein